MNFFKHVSRSPLALTLALSLALSLALTPARAEWRPATALPTTVPKAMAAAMESRLYVMSGTVGTGLRQFFELYDITNDGWRPLTPLPASLSHFSLSAGAGRVFVSGGRDADSAALADGLWMYAPENALWLELGSMPSKRAGHVSFVDQNRVFIVGGEGEQAASVQSYGLDTGKWKTWNNQMPVGVINAAMSPQGDEYIFAGGSDARGNDVTTVQAFNPKTGAWRLLPSLPMASSGGALGVVNGRLHYAGGYNKKAKRVLDNHIMLDDNEWTKQSSLPQARHQMAYFGTGDALIVIGGAMGSGFYSLFTASDRVTIFRP
jgi:N-acetylneuraminic acid mutarotase